MQGKQGNRLVIIQQNVKKSYLPMPLCTIGSGQSGIHVLSLNLNVDMYMSLFDFQFKFFVVNYQIFKKSFPSKLMKNNFSLELFKTCKVKTVFNYQTVGSGNKYE